MRTTIGILVSIALCALIFGCSSDDGGGNVIFSVNTNTDGNQADPSVGADDRGDFAIAWTSYGQDGSEEGIFLQRFNSSKKKQGNEVQVNEFTPGAQDTPDIAMNSNGQSVVVWRSLDQDGDSYGIAACIFDPAGAKAQDEFIVNTTTENSQTNPSVAMDEQGNFIVAWEGAVLETSSAQQSTQDEAATQIDIFVQRFDSAGNRIGDELIVNTYTSFNQTKPEIACDANGNALIVWESRGADGSELGVFGRYLDSGGNFTGDEFQVNTYTSSYQDSPGVAMAADGSAVVVWQSYAQDGSEYGIFGQRFNASGNKNGGEIRINSYTTSYQVHPAVAMQPDGSFMVAWVSMNEQEGELYDIYARAFDANGVANGQDILVNKKSIAGWQQEVSIAAAENGNYIITWSHSDTQESNRDIYARKLKP